MQPAVKLANRRLETDGTFPYRGEKEAALVCNWQEKAHCQLEVIIESNNSSLRRPYLDDIDVSF